MIKQCKTCLKEFTAKRSTALFCSNLCKQVNKRNKPNIIKELKAKIQAIQNKPQTTTPQAKQDMEIIPYSF